MRAWFSLILVLATLFWGCGGAEVVSLGPPLSPGSDLEAQKLAAREAVRATFDTLAHESPSDDNEALAAYMRGQAIFSQVQVLPGLILAEFPDGELYYVMNNLAYFDGPEPDDNLFKAREALQPLQDEGQPAQFVDGKRCFLVNAFADNIANVTLGDLRNGASDTLGRIANMLTSKGYTLNGPSFASYDAFRKSFSSVDVLVWCGHSAGNASNLLLTIPFTNDPTVENGSDPDVKAKILLRGDTVVGQVLKGRVPGLSVEHLVQLTPTYAITSGWLSKYVAMNERSLVMMMACGSANDPKLRESLNPGTYVGWKGGDEISCQDAFPTTEAFFDVALSAGTLGLYDPEDPPANDFQSVLSFLSQTGRDKLPAGTDSARHPYQLGTSQIVAAHGRNTIISTLAVQGTGLLTPWIETAEAASSVLTLTGNFGDDPGEGNRKVTLENGTELTVTSWSSGTITCSGQDVTDGSKVRVTALDHPSNLKVVHVDAGPGVAWSIEMNFTETLSGSLHYSYDIVLKVFAPELAPGLLGSPTAQASSTAFLSAGGTLVNGMSTTTWSTSVTGSLLFVTDFTPGADGQCYTIMALGPGSSSLRLFMSGGFNQGITATDEQGGTTQEPALLATPLLFPAGPNMPIDLPLDGNLNVLAGSQTATSGERTITLTWKAAPAKK